VVCPDWDRVSGGIGGCADFMMRSDEGDAGADSKIIEIISKIVNHVCFLKALLTKVKIRT
jgi:hypothetical protein